MRYSFRPLLWLVLIVIGLSAAAIAWLILPLLIDPEPGFVERKGSLAVARQESIDKTGNVEYLNFTVQSNSGLKVRLSVRKPQSQSKPLPLVILAGGHRTGRKAVRLIDTAQPVIVAAISYPYTASSHLKGWSVMPALADYANALRDFTPAIMLVVDYLAAQAYVDPQHIELVGVSLGAFLVATPAALDERIKRVWLIHGAGNPQQVFEHALRHRIKVKNSREIIARLLTILTSAEFLRPEKWVKRIGKRQMIVMNARGDERLPKEAVSALHQSLPGHAELIWTTGLHVEPGRKDVINELTGIVFQRVSRD